MSPLPPQSPVLWAPETLHHMLGLGLRVEGSGFRGLGFWVEDLGYGMESLSHAQKCVDKSITIFLP